jgi:superfamily II DNA/RNA helicase
MSSADPTDIAADLEREFWKLDTVHHLWQIGMLNRAVIFCSGKERVDWLTEKLRDWRIPALNVHSGVDYEERKRRIRKFSLGSVGILITTDLLARSLDGLRVPVIINVSTFVSIGQICS